MQVGLKRYKQRLFPERKYRAPRLWSNEVLRRIAPFFTGSIVNVSGWKDSDKDGGRYQDYFENVSTYSLTNFPGARGHEDSKDGIELDLEKELPDYLRNNFDVVFNHTTLEHLFNIELAFRNLCSMSKDIVIVVVPFLQEMHIYEDSYKDYWRFTPYALKELFKKNGMELIFCEGGIRPRASVYLVAVGSKKAEQWREKLLTQNGAFRLLGDKAIPSHGGLYTFFKTILEILRGIF